MYLVAADNTMCDGSGTCFSEFPRAVFDPERDEAEPASVPEYMNCLTCMENGPLQAATVSEL